MSIAAPSLFRFTVASLTTLMVGSSAIWGAFAHSRGCRASTTPLRVNCTTLAYQMMQRIVGYLPLSYRLIFSGYLPEYVYRVGGFDQRHSLEELRARGHISGRARKADRSETFSADIRRGIPGISPGDLPNHEALL